MEILAAAVHHPSHGLGSAGPAARMNLGHPRPGGVGRSWYSAVPTTPSHATPQARAPTRDLGDLGMPPSTIHDTALVLAHSITGEGFPVTCPRHTLANFGSSLRPVLQAGGAESDRSDPCAARPAPAPPGGRAHARFTGAPETVLAPAGDYESCRGRMAAAGQDPLK